MATEDLHWAGRTTMASDFLQRQPSYGGSGGGGQRPLHSPSPAAAGNGSTHGRGGGAEPGLSRSLSLSR